MGVSPTLGSPRRGEDAGMEQDIAADQDPARTPSSDTQDRPAHQDGDDATWGHGSATAMDRLRQHNYRGRGQPTGERPSSE